MAVEKNGGYQLNLAEEMKDILAEFSDDLKEQEEIALTKASEFLLDKLVAASPVRTGEFKKSWVLKTKYKGVRYIGNSKVSAKNIPIANLIEFSKKGKPFIRRTFEQNKSEIINIIKGELSNGERR